MYRCIKVSDKKTLRKCRSNSILNFGLDEDNESSQRFKISHVTQLKADVFEKRTEFYSNVSKLVIL